MSRSFADFSLPQSLTDAIKKLGFENPTPVQEQSIPVVMEGKDLVSLAETGSGKTAAFLIPTIARTLESNESNGKQVLVLAPTRELAMQIVDVLKTLTVFTPKISGCVLIGGAPMDRQIKNLQRRPRFVIATPGRLMDHQRRRSIDLRHVDTLILDEADRMFDMGFAPQIREILRWVPKERQTLLFSATFPKEIRELAQHILINPVDITIQKSIRPPVKIEQKAIDLSPEAKNDKTLDLINAATGSVLIFTRTKSRTDRLARYLAEYGVKVARIHGDRSQGQRNGAINGFKSGEFKVLVATDIAARGIDVASVSDVINYDLPENYEDYVHRIGRTGRAGREGQAITLVTGHDRHKWGQIARKIGLAPAQEPRGQGGHRPPARGGAQQDQRRHGSKRPSHVKPYKKSHAKSGGGGWPKQGASQQEGEGAARQSGFKSSGPQKPSSPYSNKPRFEKPRHGKPKKFFKMSSSISREALEG